MALARIGLLLAAIVAIGWFGIVQRASAVQFSIAIADIVDQRPSERILFVGNSRTYQNDLPYMVRRMADSAGSPIRYDIVVRGFGGASLEAHWKSPESREIIAQEDWDKVIVQAESRAHGSEEQRSSFLHYGQRLFADTRAKQSSLIVNWNYGPKLYEGHPPETRQDYFAKIQAYHRRLAHETGANLINVGLIWEDVLASHVPFSLTRDGNHATPQGSYLAALVVYASLSGTDGSEVTYIPAGMSGSDAALIRSTASEAIRSRPL